MHSTLTVLEANENRALTTLDRVKAELGISGGAHDALLTLKIDEASSDIEAHLGRVLRRETLEQTFWGQSGAADVLVLDRYPVAAINSISIDGATALDAADYRVTSGGLLYLLSNGAASSWSFAKSIVVDFDAGYVMPDEDTPDLPGALEAACVELVVSYWSSRGRDPTVREEDIPGVLRKVYWVGAVGAAGELPPSVEAKLRPFRAMVI